MFRRKGEGNSESTENSPEEVDLSPLAAEENPVVEALENINRRGEAAVEEAERVTREGAAEAEAAAGTVAGTIDRAINEARPAEAAVPRKKRYYSPSEVRRKKGCIGCGGMVLAVPFLVSVVGIAVALL